MNIDYDRVTLADVLFREQKEYSVEIGNKTCVNLTPFELEICDPKDGVTVVRLFPQVGMAVQLNNLEYTVDEESSILPGIALPIRAMIPRDHKIKHLAYLNTLYDIVIVMPEVLATVRMLPLSDQYRFSKTYSIDMHRDRLENNLTSYYDITTFRVTGLLY